MRRIVLSRLRLQWTRYVLICLCVAVSAAFATGSLLLGTTMKASLVSTLADATRNADLVITQDFSGESAPEEGGGEAGDDDAGATETDPDAPQSPFGADYVSTADLESLSELDGVASVWTQPTVPVEVEGSGEPRPLSSVPEDGSLFPWELEDGSLPREPGQIALAGGQADRLGVGIGDTLTASAVGAGFGPEVPGLPTGEPVELTVTAIVGPEASSSFETGWVHPQDLETLSPASYDQLPAGYTTQVALEDGADLETVRTELQDGLAEISGAGGFLVQTPQEQTDSALEELGAAADGITAFLLAFALLAVLVSFLVITTTFGVLTAQRARELALLRCLGATGGQLQRSVVLEALVIGLVSSAIGVAAVVALAFGLAPLLPETITVTVAVAPKDILAGIGLGILVTVLASLGPARRALRASPLDGMRGSRRAERIPWVRSILGLAVLVPSGVALTWAAGVHDQPVVGILSGIGAGLGLILTSRLWMPTIVGVLGRALPGGVPSRLAAANASRHRSRTTTTATALLIGITLVTTVLTGHAVAQKSVLDELDRSIPVDVSIEGPLDDGVRGQIEQVEHVSSTAEDGDRLEIDLERGIGGRETNEALEQITELTGTEIYDVGTNALEKSLYVDILNILLWVALGLLAAAVAVSVLGITSTMSLSVLERTRENSLLRALGLSRRQLGATVRSEALIIAVAAAVAGVVAGWLLGTGVVSAMVTDAVPVALTVPWGGLAAVAAGTWLVAMLSAALPARRAIRVPPVQGLASLD